MNFDDYQAQALRTRVYRPAGDVLYPALKLAGEAGEVAQKVAKALYRDGDGLTPDVVEALKLELGDVLWYVAALAADLGLTMDQVAQANVDKLGRRLAQGTLHGDGDAR